MFQVFETVSGRRRYAGCSESLACQMVDALERTGIKAFKVKT